MLRKLKKILPAIVSAVLCVTMTLGIAASAADKTVFSDMQALTPLKYNSTSIKWLKKYSEKDSKSTVTYSKSRTKKFLDRLFKESDKDSPELALGLTTKNNFLYFACKGNDKLKIVTYVDDEATVMYVADGNVTMLDPESKTKVETESEGLNLAGFAGIMTENFDFDISENEKGKIFKLKSNDKIYYYEEFECDEYDHVGFIFTEKGTPIAMMVDDEYYCIKYSLNVKDSEFDVPKGYKTVDFDDFEY